MSGTSQEYKSASIALKLGILTTKLPSKLSGKVITNGGRDVVEEFAIKKTSRGLSKNGADDETRTRDSLLGRQILYQLSYVRI